MKRHGNLYPKIYGIENIRIAHKNARKGKSHYREVRKIEENPEKYFRKIQLMLKDKTFENSCYEIMIKKTDNGKIREIYKLPYFPDRIIHHCIVQILEPIWEKTLIKDTYACLKNRGIHKALARIQEALRDKHATKYCLKLDVRKFYPSIDHTVLKTIIRKKIKDMDLLWLLDNIIDSAPGVPIGNYLSQYFGNLYLSGLDHFVKEKKRRKYYYRYSDDIVVFGNNKKELHKLRKDISDYLDELKLKLKDNWQVFPVSARGVDFLGYRFFHGYTLLRKSIALKFKRKIRKIKNNWRNMKPEQIINSVMSYNGWLIHSNTKNLRNAYIDDDIFWIMKQTAYESNIKNPLQGVV